MTEPILILLSGGRGEWPNVWSVLAFRPSHVYILSPEGGERGVKILTTWLSHRGVPHEMLPPIDAFDAVAAKAACEAVFRRHPDLPILINLTQAPKMLAIGASFAAFSASLDGRIDICAFHRDTAADISHAAFGAVPQPSPCVMTVDDYLSAYGCRGQAKFSPTSYPWTEATLQALARQFAGEADDYLLLIAPVHKSPELKRGAERVSFPDYQWREPWSLLLTGLSEAGLVADLSLTPGRRGFRLTSSAAWDFLNGKWLEVYAQDAATRAVAVTTGAALFEDCQSGVEIMMQNWKVEIDLACLDRAGMFLYGSCKTSGGLKPEMLKEMGDRAALLGGAYCAKVFITTTPGVVITTPFLDQARERNIEVISGEELPQLAARFGAVMAAARRAAR